MAQTSNIHAITIVGQLPQSELEQLLADAQLSPHENGTIELVLSSDYHHPDLAALNQAHLASSTPWMLARPMGKILWIGPIFIPDETGCWACLSERLRQNQQNGDAEPFTLQGASRAFELIRDELQKTPIPSGQLITFDTQTAHRQTHHLVRLPDCPACGTQSPTPPRPIVLDGGLPISPEQTFQRYQHHISPLLGVVHSITRAETQDESLHVYNVAHNPFLSGQSFGKGHTEAQARVSGLCEALERYSSRFQGHEPRIQARYDSLIGQAIPPAQLLGYSESQYQQRETWNTRFPGVFIPEPFNEDHAIDWSPVESLSSQETRYIPTALAYMGYPQRPRWAVSSSNGNAAGATLEEAIFQAILELVERDAVAIWWYNRLRRPAVSLDHPSLHALTAAYTQRGLKIWLLDLTTDLGIPVFVAGCAGRMISLGFGCHLNAEVAAQRALAELAQAYSREDHIMGLVESFPQLREHPQIIADCPALRADSQQKNRTLTDFDTSNARTFEQAIRESQARIEKQGLDILALNLTRPESGLPVAKVVIPSLCHWNVNLGYARLYDVPVSLGWRVVPTPEKDLLHVPPLV